VNGHNGDEMMKFRFDHNNINVLDLDKSVSFYKEALGLGEIRRKEASDKSFILVFLGDETTGHNSPWLKSGY
jgi:lactoylglutathione lyase